jgi:hypothetical protein
MKSAKTQAPDLPDLDSTFRARANSGSWCLPSGTPLGEYALQAGFLVPSLWNVSVRRAFARNHQAAWLSSFRGPMFADTSRRLPRATVPQAVREC